MWVPNENRSLQVLQTQAALLRSWVCRRRENSWFQMEFPLEKRRRMQITTAYFYELIHINMSALSARKHVFGRFGTVPGRLFMFCMGLGNAMALHSFFLLKAGKSVRLTSFWGSPARLTVAAARTTADSSEIGL